jgi:N-acetylmuramoyl-L-alanine amidase
VLHLSKLVFGVLCLVILTGCPTPPKRVPRPLSLESARTVPPSEVQVAPQEVKPIVPDRTPPTNDIPVKPTFPVRQWISFNDWSRQNGNAKLQARSTPASGPYELRGSNGLLSINVGSRVAYWNGLSLSLGFVPRLTNGEPFIHSLDIEKNFEPLITPFASCEKPSRIVVIDPGHGGEDNGAKSVINGGFEKDYSLDWALRVQSLLSSNGWKVFLTRNRDAELPLADRVAFADKVQADLFISLHFNSVDSRAVRREHHGLETYCLTPSGMPSNLLRDYVDDPSKVFPNNAFDAQNLQYAMRLHQAMVQLTQRKDRGVRRARFMGVLRGQNRPAVLLEGGYLTDPEEARLIASASYRQKLALAVAKALAF